MKSSIFIGMIWLIHNFEICNSYQSGRLLFQKQVIRSNTLVKANSNNYFDGILEFFSPKKGSTIAASSKTPLKLRTIAITGASGLLGNELSVFFKEKGVNVVQISQSIPEDSTSTLRWLPSEGLFNEFSALEGVDAVIHLAGENVASGEGLLAILGRWTNAKKDRIVSSRLDSTKLLVESISKLKKKPKVLLSSSAVGFYGYQDAETVFDESSTDSGSGFLAGLCEQWESEALRAQSLGVRTVCLRFAPIFSSKAGILAKLLPIFGLGVGGKLGSGSQGFSWVGIADVVRAIDFLLTDEKAQAIKGPVNVCSPNPVNNEQFTAAMGRVLSRPVILPVPEIAAKAIFGEMGQEMLLGGQKVLPSKLTAAGFQFEYADIDSAIAREVSKKK